MVHVYVTYKLYIIKYETFFATGIVFPYISALKNTFNLQRFGERY